ncbi:hypothetical protein B566_EDAN009444 [Ephemera danica]|nr:hypothetical protein B566_EDAN009444 [Ephemera danica]
MGTVWETPSPESSTIPVVRPEAYRESTAWMATYMAGVLKVSNMICKQRNGIATHLSHLFTVGLGVKGSLCQENGVFLRGDSQLIVEGMMPDLLHVIPVCYNAVFNGVLEGEDTSLGLGLITNITVFLAHTHHHTLKDKACC